jgi:SAM-dependent methyltransferase
MKYDFLDIGCKDGRSFPIAYELGYKSGLGIDINENHVKSAISKGLRTFYSHWKGHTNMMKLSNLLDIFSKYKYDLKMIKRLTIHL